MKYKGQQKEDLPYGRWMRAITQVKRVRQNRSREKGNREQVQSRANVQPTTSTKPTQSQQNLGEQNGSQPNDSGPELNEEVEPVGISRGLGADKKQLMLAAIELEDKQVEGQCESDVINEELNRLTRNDSCSRKGNLRAGNEDWWENVTLERGENLKI